MSASDVLQNEPPLRCSEAYYHPHPPSLDDAVGDVGDAVPLLLQCGDVLTDVFSFLRPSDQHALRSTCVAAALWFDTAAATYNMIPMFVSGYGVQTRDVLEVDDDEAALDAIDFDEGAAHPSVEEEGLAGVGVSHHQDPRFVTHRSGGEGASPAAGQGYDSPSAPLPLPSAARTAVSWRFAPVQLYRQDMFISPTRGVVPHMLCGVRVGTLFVNLRCLDAMLAMLLQEMKEGAARGGGDDPSWAAIMAAANGSNNTFARHTSSAVAAIIADVLPSAFASASTSSSPHSSASSLPPPLNATASAPHCPQPFFSSLHEGSPSCYLPFMCALPPQAMAAQLWHVDAQYGPLLGEKCDGTAFDAALHEAARPPPPTADAMAVARKAVALLGDAAVREFGQRMAQYEAEKKKGTKKGIASLHQKHHSSSRADLLALRDVELRALHMPVGHLVGYDDANHGNHHAGPSTSAHDGGEGHPRGLLALRDSFLQGLNARSVVFLDPERVGAIGAHFLADSGISVAVFDGMINCHRVGASFLRDCYNLRYVNFGGLGGSPSSSRVKGEGVPSNGGSGTRDDPASSMFLPSAFRGVSRAMAAAVKSAHLRSSSSPSPPPITVGGVPDFTLFNCKRLRRVVFPQTYIHRCLLRRDAYYSYALGGGGDWAADDGDAADGWGGAFGTDADVCNTAAGLPEGADGPQPCTASSHNPRNNNSLPSCTAAGDPRSSSSELFRDCLGIGDSVLENCPSLVSVDLRGLSSSCVAIGSGFLCNASSLKAFHVRTQRPACDGAMAATIADGLDSSAPDGRNADADDNNDDGAADADVCYCPFAIKTIGDRFLMHCKALVSADFEGFGDSLESVGVCWLAGCPLLETVSFRAMHHLTSVGGMWMGGGCASLGPIVSLKDLVSLRSVGPRWLSQTPQLEGVEWPSDESADASRKAGSDMGRNPRRSVVAPAASAALAFTTVPALPRQQPSAIGNGAFQESGIVRVVMDGDVSPFIANLTRIGDNCFANCPRLEVLLLGCPAASSVAQSAGADGASSSDFPPPSSTSTAGVPDVPSISVTSLRRIAQLASIGNNFGLNCPRLQLFGIVRTPHLRLIGHSFLCCEMRRLAVSAQLIIVFLPLGISDGATAADGTRADGSDAPVGESGDASSSSLVAARQAAARIGCEEALVAVQSANPIHYGLAIGGVRIGHDALFEAAAAVASAVAADGAGAEGADDSNTNALLHCTGDDCTRAHLFTRHRLSHRPPSAAAGAAGDGTAMLQCPSLAVGAAKQVAADRGLANKEGEKGPQATPSSYHPSASSTAFSTVCERYPAIFAGVGDASWEAYLSDSALGSLCSLPVTDWCHSGCEGGVGEGPPLATISAPPPSRVSPRTRRGKKPRKWKTFCAVM